MLSIGRNVSQCVRLVVHTVLCRLSQRCEVRRYALWSPILRLSGGDTCFLAPGQVYGIESNGVKVQPKGWALVFHPDLIRGTSLGRHIDDYTFFSYEVNEALHISEQERSVVMECLHNIASELKHAIDKHSRMLIVSNIELLLNYCMRFYDRQFITRSMRIKM